MDRMPQIRMRYRFVLLIPFRMLYEYCCSNIEKRKTKQNMHQEEIIIQEMLNKIENQVIQQELRQLILGKQDDTCKLDIIRKYNKKEYMSNEYIKKIINFAILQFELKSM